MPKNDSAPIQLARPRPARALPLSVARTLFVVFALVPVVGTATWATWRQVSQQPSRYEDWLGARLGLEVVLHKLQQPQPGRERIDRAELLDPESGNLLGQAEGLRVTHTRDTVEVECEAIFIPRHQVMPLWRLLHDRALRERHLLEREVTIKSDRVVIQSAQGRTDLTAWKLKLNRNSKGHFATASFVETGAGAKPINVSISRQPVDGERVTELNLLTDGLVEATTLFGDVAWLDQLGARPRLQGNLWIEQTTRGWSLDFAGTLQGLDLERLVSRRFPHQLSGEATAEIHQLLITHGTIQKLTGRLKGEVGHVSRSLLTAAEEFLDMRANAGGADRFRFDELHVLVNVDKQGLVLRGDGEIEGALLT
ncbi:MAG: hypothetical protein AAGF97_04115, partial [Planctomycetota bacterium]